MGSLSAQDCLNLAYANMLETGVSVYSLNTKSDPKECRLPDQDDPDCSTSEGQLGPFNSNPGKKAKIFEATLAECNNFAMQQGSEWFSYREDQGICWHGN